MLEILRDIVSGTRSVSLAVAALPVRRLEGPGSSNSSESDVILCGVNRSEPSFGRACPFAAGDLSIAGAAGIVGDLVSVCGRFPGAFFIPLVLGGA